MRSSNFIALVILVFAVALFAMFNSDTNAPKRTATNSQQFVSTNSQQQPIQPSVQQNNSVVVAPIPTVMPCAQGDTICLEIAAQQAQQAAQAASSSADSVQLQLARAEATESARVMQLTTDAQNAILQLTIQAQAAADSAEATRSHMEMEIAQQQAIALITQQAIDAEFNRQQIIAAETQQSVHATLEAVATNDARAEQKRVEQREYDAAQSAYQFNRNMRLFALAFAIFLAVILVGIVAYAIKSMIDSKREQEKASQPIFQITVDNRKLIAMNGPEGPKLVDPAAFGRTVADLPQLDIPSSHRGGRVRPVRQGESRRPRGPVRPSSNPVLKEMVSYRTATMRDRTGQALLRYLAKMKVMLIWGAQGSGKTELALHLVSMKENVTVLDTKPRTRWPSKCQVFGQRENYDEVVEWLGIFVKMMSVESQKMADNIGYNPPERWLVVDEFSDLVEIVGDSAAGPLKRLMMKGREYGIRIIVISQSNDVTSLGFKGQGKLRAAFCDVHATIDDMEEREVETTLGETVRQFDHPGVFYGEDTLAHGEVVNDSDEDWLESLNRARMPEFASEDSAENVIDSIVESRYGQATSLRHLERLVYGNDNGGNQYYALKNSLERLGLSSPARNRRNQPVMA